MIQYDFSKGVPEELENIKFDIIISTYAMHHLADEEKVDLICKLENHLSEEGKIIIGDVAFETRKLLEQCKDESNQWDDEEIYFVFDEIKESLSNKDIDFTTISHCAGVIHIKKQQMI